MRSQIAARDEPADDAAGQHQRQHLRAARGAEAEVAAVGDDVHLRHRHRDAAGDAGDAQQQLRRVQRQAEGPRRRHRAARPGDACAAAATAGGRAPHQQRQRGHRHAAEDAHAEVGLAPADALDEVLHDRRPDRAGDVVAAGADRDGDAAPAHEPERGVGDQRREASPSCRAGRAAAPCARAKVQMLPDRPAATKPSAEPGGADQQRHSTPTRSASRPISDAADAEADHQQRVGQRGIGAGDAELGLHRSAARPRRRTCAAADRHQQQGDGEAGPGVARVDRVGCHRPIVRTRP